MAAVPCPGRVFGYDETFVFAGTLVKLKEEATRTIKTGALVSDTQGVGKAAMVATNDMKRNADHADGGGIRCGGFN